MPAHRQLAILGLMLLVNLGGCSNKALYATGQGMQRNECAKIEDAEQRGKCLDRAAKSQQEYEAAQP